MALFNKKNENEDLNVLYAREEGHSRKKASHYYFGEDRKSVRDLIAPNGGNTAPLQYMTINDAGRDSYFVGLYIEKMSRYPVIATTFAKLMDFPGVTSTVYIHPLLEESIKRVNKRIDMLDSEQDAAKNNRNRQREIAGKMENVESLAKSLDSGQTSLFEVYFLFLLRRDSIEELQAAVAEITAIARRENMELASTYAANPEAFLTSLPMNKLFNVTYSGSFMKYITKDCPIKKHIMNEDSLSTIFNHTNAEFFHKDGILLGYNRYNGMPFSYDFFDPSHYGFTNIIAGLQGYGKSATVKEICSRSVDFDYCFASIDYENNGRRGEYANACESVGGVNFNIGASGGGDRINLFELNEETELDEVTKNEYRVLRLNEKVTDLTNILLSIALSSGAGSEATGSYDPMDVDRMQEIITRVVQWLYAQAGIKDGDPDSLYETSSTGRLTAGRVKKYLPQMKDFYMALLIASQENTDTFKDNAFALLKDKFVNRVNELYYCSECLREFTREEYEKLPQLANGMKYHTHEQRQSPVIAVHGSAAYFDFQSTVSLADNVPWFNFDISGAPESDRAVLILVCQNFIMENFIKRNSVDATRAKKMVFLIDEFHKIIGMNPRALKIMNSTYRIARKRHVAPLLITQSIADFGKSPEALEILKLTETIMLLKHQQSDKAFIKENTFLSDSQIDTIMSLGGTPNNKKYGEMCVVDKSISTASFVNVVYLKNSEEYIVETDTEKRARLAQKN